MRTGIASILGPTGIAFALCCMMGNTNNSYAASLSFAANSVIAQVTPGAAVDIYGVARVPNGYNSATRVFQFSTRDEHRTGTVQYDLGFPVPAKSIWFVVDHSDGGFAIENAVPDAWQRLDMPADLLRPGANSQDVLNIDATYVVIALARPGQGMWAGGVHRGSKPDVSPRDGHGVAISVASLKSLGAAGRSPDRLVPGDVVLVVEPRGMTYAVSRLTPGGFNAR